MAFFKILVRVALKDGVNVVLDGETEKMRQKARPEDKAATVAHQIDRYISLFIYFLPKP